MKSAIVCRGYISLKKNPPKKQNPHVYTSVVTLGESRHCVILRVPIFKRIKQKSRNHSSCTQVAKQLKWPCPAVI